MTAATPACSVLDLQYGETAYALAGQLWPIPRSLTGIGVRVTLAQIQKVLPALRLHTVASNTQVLDWIVPDEWALSEAWIETPDGERIANFADNNLHVVGYSTAVDTTLSLDELQPHLYSLPEQPDAIPYVTSYYQRRWGFCLSHQSRMALKPGRYRAMIAAKHFAGQLDYADLLIPGQSQQEVLLSSYICHPSMANNELSGPCLLTQLGAWLQSQPRRLSYRLIFVPEMLGSIAYLHANLPMLKERTVAGFNLSCVGDERAVSYLPSRHGATLADRVALHVLKHASPAFHHYSWTDRGSDESNYCAPGVDLPVASVMRSKYGSYPEYHTSLDNLDLISARGLGQSFALYRQMLEALECNATPITNVLGEPQLGRRGLYPSVSQKGSTASVRTMLDLISYADGQHDLLAIADRLGKPIHTLRPLLDQLLQANVLRLANPD